MELCQNDRVRDEALQGETVGKRVLGPRLGKYRADGRTDPLPAHNVPMYMTGALVLTFGAWWTFDRATMAIPWAYATRCAIAASPFRNSACIPMI